MDRLHGECGAAFVVLKKMLRRMKSRQSNSCCVRLAADEHPKAVYFVQDITQRRDRKTAQERTRAALFDRVIKIKVRKFSNFFSFYLSKMLLYFLGKRYLIYRHQIAIAI